jgi:hypothetical protein
MSFWVVSGYHGLFEVNDYTHLLPGFLSGDCRFATVRFWVSYRQLGRYLSVTAELGNNSPGTMRMLFPGRASTVREVGALSDLDNISVRIADVAARLPVLGDRLREELRSSTFP